MMRYFVTGIYMAIFAALMAISLILLGRNNGQLAYSIIDKLMK